MRFLKIHFLNAADAAFSQKIAFFRVFYIWSTFLGTTMGIRVTRPLIVSFISGDQYVGPGYFIIMLRCTVLLNNSKQIKSKIVK